MSKTHESNKKGKSKTALRDRIGAFYSKVKKIRINKG